MSWAHLRRAPPDDTRRAGAYLDGRSSAVDPRVHQEHRTLSHSTAPGLDTAVIHRLLEPYARRGSPGAAVAILRHGEILFTHACGLARLDGSIAVDGGTNFRLASITKQFTARAVALLIEEGRLGLATPVGEVLRELPAWGERVRIGHLICHTSGLPHYEALVPETQTEQVTDADVVRLLAARSRLHSEPGTRFEYSNGAYALLARAIEELAGISFGAFLDERIFRPLGMTGTLAHVEGRTVVGKRAIGYRPVDRGFVEADQGPTTATLGDGGIYSSICDLARWDAALNRFGDRPGPTDLAPYAAPGPDGAGYGFGWFLDRYRGRRRQRHEGWTTGFQNEIQRFPDEGLTMIMLTNRSRPYVQGTTEAIADLLLEGGRS